MVNVPLFTNTVLGGTALEGGLNLMRLTVALPFGALAGGVPRARAYGYTPRLRAGPGAGRRRVPRHVALGQGPGRSW